MTTATVATPVRFERPQKKQRSAITLKAIARCVPKQGNWTIDDFDYFSARLDDKPPFEFSHGRVVRKSVSITIHVLIVAYLRWELEAFVRAKKLGRVFAENPELRYSDVLVRIPDVVFVSNENFGKYTDKGWPVFDIAMEVLSPSNWREDVIEKRKDYALAGLPEYWIVDAKRKQITVLKLNGGKYVEHGVFEPGEKATSSVLEGFDVDVTEALAGK